MVAAQYQICLTILAALAIGSELVPGLSSFSFGLVLVAINTTVVLMVGLLASFAASADRKMKKKLPGAHW